MKQENLMDFNKKKSDVETEVGLKDPVEIFIPEWHSKPYICDDFHFTSMKKRKEIIEALKKEIEKERKEGRFKDSGSNTDGFNISFPIDGELIEMSFIADIPKMEFIDLTKEKPMIEKQGEEKEIFTKKHENAHGIFKKDYNDLEEIGKGGEFIEECIVLLKAKNFWEKWSNHVLENWKLISLGFSYNEKMLNLERRINDLLRSNSLDIGELFDVIGDEFGQAQLSRFKKSIILEIDGDAHGGNNRQLVNLIRQAKINVAGEEFLHRNAPMEVG
jgi:hypothetical protein